MAKEIERKFLVDAAKLPDLPRGTHIVQGYIPSDAATVRVRIRDGRAFLTLKGKTEGLTRSEFEYAVPLEDAEAMMEGLCARPYIEKRRYEILHEGHLWELDVFEGENRGLIVAEIELSFEEEIFAKPDWVTKEVTFDTRYRNAYLVKHPFNRW